MDENEFTTEIECADECEHAEAAMRCPVCRGHLTGAKGVGEFDPGVGGGGLSSFSGYNTYYGTTVSDLIRYIGDVFRQYFIDSGLVPHGETTTPTVREGSIDPDLDE